jgi:hypothetical protein
MEGKSRVLPPTHLKKGLLDDVFFIQRVVTARNSRLQVWRIYCKILQSSKKCCKGRPKYFGLISRNYCESANLGFYKLLYKLNEYNKSTGIFCTLGLMIYFAVNP